MIEKKHEPNTTKSSLRVGRNDLVLPVMGLVFTITMVAQGAPRAKALERKNINHAMENNMRRLKIDMINRKLVFNNMNAGIGWTLELEQDMKNNVPSGLDVRAEVVSAMLDALDKKYSLTSAERTLSKMILDKSFKEIYANRS